MNGCLSYLKPARFFYFGHARHGNGDGREQCHVHSEYQSHKRIHRKCFSHCKRLALGRYSQLQPGVGQRIRIFNAHRFYQQFDPSRQLYPDGYRDQRHSDAHSYRNVKRH